MSKACSNACPDCPAKRNAVLDALTRDRCVLRCAAVRARDPLPRDWFGGYRLMIVRRGVIVRQRVDASGCATAIDAIGPGAVAPLSEAAAAHSCGYAASDALVCLMPERLVRFGGGTTAADLVQLYATALERMERIAQARSRGRVIARVASLIGTLADCLAPPGKLDLVPASLQQRDLAALLSMRHESVCRVLSALERRSLLRRSDDGIRVLDRAGLEHV